MEDKIKSICEAYSMQPCWLMTQTEKEYEGYWDKPSACKEIKFEVIEIGGKKLEVYVGYNFEGKRLFQYLVDSVNVNYDPNP